MANLMKIAIATDNETVSGHFGRCQCYTIYKVDGNEIKGMERVDTPEHQPGLIPRFLASLGVNVVIAGGMGPKAQHLFKEMNIEVMAGISGQVEAVMDEYVTGALVAGESSCTHDSGGHSHHCGHH